MLENHMITSAFAQIKSLKFNKNWNGDSPRLEFPGSEREEDGGRKKESGAPRVQNKSWFTQ